MSYTVKGKIEVGAPQRKNPESNGIPRATKVGLDLKVYDEQGELDNERVQAAGLAWNTRFGFRHESGEEVYVDGKGASGEVFPEGHEHAGYAVPNPGYVLEGPGISALENSNGFRMVVNFKKLAEGYWTAFGEVRGAGTAQFDGDTIRIGKAKPRSGGGRHK